MDEHGHGHGHALLGLPAAVWIAGAALLALFIYSHRSTVSGVTLPSSTQADLANSQDEAARLQVQAQQEALAAKTATDAFNLQSQSALFGQQLGNTQTAFNNQEAAIVQQQQAQAGANALALQGGSQALLFNAQNQALGVQTRQIANSGLQQGVNAQTIANSAQKAKNQQASSVNWINALSNIADTVGSWLGF